jgi:hypothetical protein
VPCRCSLPVPFYRAVHLTVDQAAYPPLRVPGQQSNRVNVLRDANAVGIRMSSGFASRTCIRGGRSADYLCPRAYVSLPPSRLGRRRGCRYRFVPPGVFDRTSCRYGQSVVRV